MKYILPFICLLAFFSCESKQDQAKILQLEKERKQLEVEKSKLEIERTNARNQLQHKERALEQSAKSTPQWERLGTVELWSYHSVQTWDTDLGVINKYKLSRAGEGGVFVKHGELGDEYELRYVNNDQNYSYHVARGNFTVETDNGYMQFNAHAGSMYFDL